MKRKLHLLSVQLMSSYKLCLEHGHRRCIWRGIYLIPLDNLGVNQRETEPADACSHCELRVPQALPSGLGTGSWPCCPHGKGHRSWEESRQESDPAQQVCTQLFALRKFPTGLDQLVIGAWCLDFPHSCGYVPAEKCVCVFWQHRLSPKRNAGPWLLQEHPSWAGAVHLTVSPETTDCNPGCVWGVSHKPPFGYLTLWAGFFSSLVQGISKYGQILCLSSNADIAVCACSLLP